MPDTYLVRPGFGLPHSAYRYYTGCRCLSCIAAYDAELLAESRKQPKRPRSTAAHGTRERAAGGCLCQPCRHTRREASRG